MADRFLNPSEDKWNGGEQTSPPPDTLNAGTRLARSVGTAVVGGRINFSANQDEKVTPEAEVEGEEPCHVSAVVRLLRVPALNCVVVRLMSALPNTVMLGPGANGVFAAGLGMRLRLSPPLWPWLRDSPDA